MAYLHPAPGSGAATETALIAAVPAAETVVGEHRRHLDGGAVSGVPAHVTILFPFVPPTAVDAQLLDTLAAVTGSVPAFDCRFARTRWFGSEVLWLDPEPAAPFLELTTAVWRAFPQYPPYGGAYDDITPHLTVAETRLADLAAVQDVERAVQLGLPVTAHVDRLLLIAGNREPSSWRLLAELPLSTAAVPATG